MKKNIFFDIYGTLVHIRTDEHSSYPYERLSSWLKEKGIEIPAEKLQHNFFRICSQHTERMKTQFPEIKIEYVFWDLLKTFKPSDELVKELAINFRKATTNEIYPIPGSIDTLKKCAEHFSLAVVSNAQRIFTETELKQFNMDKHFDHIFISSDIGVRKPSEKFFKYALEKMNAKARDSIFVGNDMKTDVKTPKQMGFTTVFVTREKDPDKGIRIKPDYSISDIRELPDLVKKI